MRKRYTASNNKIEFGFKDVWKYRELLYSLASRDIRLRYKQTFFGVSWVILQPILTSAIFSIIFGRLANLPSGDVPYELFAFVGLLPWNLFAQSIQRASRSIVKDQELITKVFFPRMIIPLSSTVSALVDFFVSLVANIIFLFFYGYSLSWKIAFLPILLILCLLISIGVGLIITALNVYYRDFNYALPFIIQTWLYISPVAYSSSLIPEKWILLYNLNPIVGVIEGFRWMVLGGTSFPYSEIIVSAVMGLIIFLFGTLFFKRLEENFADVV